MPGNDSGKGLDEKASVHQVARGSILTGNDSVLDKPYSQEETRLIGYLYAGKHPRSVKGMGLITLRYTDYIRNKLAYQLPGVDKSSGKTKRMPTGQAEAALASRSVSGCASVRFPGGRVTGRKRYDKDS